MQKKQTLTITVIILNIKLQFTSITTLTLAITKLNQIIS